MRASSPMSALSLNISHIGSLPSQGQQQTWPRHASVQQSKASNTSINTVQHNTQQRNVSTSSAGSLGSHSTGPLRVRNENVSPNRSASCTTLSKTAKFSRKGSPSEYPTRHTSYKPSWMDRMAMPPQGELHPSLLISDGTLEDVDLHSIDDSPSSKSSREEDKDRDRNHWCGASLDLERCRTQITDKPLLASTRNDEIGSPSIVVTDSGTNAFKKFMGALRAQGSKHEKTLGTRTERWPLAENDEDTLTNLNVPRPAYFKGHRKASSWSSNGFVSAVKSATAGLGPQSAAKESEKGSRLRFFRRSNQSSRMSDVTNRRSMDSSQDVSRFIDEAARDRAIQRRKILEELVASEEGYINDLKILAHVCICLHTTRQG